MPLADASVQDSRSQVPSDARPAPALRRHAALVVGALLAAAGVVLWRSPAANEALFHAVNDLGPSAPAAWSSLSVAGLGLAAWIYLTAFAQDRPARVAQLLWILVVGGIVIHFVKHGFASPRPLLTLGAAGVNVVGEELRTQSMPSGHSAMAFAMLGLMLAEAPAWPARLGWGLLSVGIALSRLAVGAHWPADALFGCGLGLVFAGLAPRAWPVPGLARLLSRPTGQRLMAAGLVVSALCIAATPDVLAALGLAHSTLEKRLATGYPLAQALQWALALVAAAGATRWWRASTTPGAPA
jgi:membrane-associated phospholipid phosphatase